MTNHLEPACHICVFTGNTSYTSEKQEKGKVLKQLQVTELLLRSLLWGFHLCYKLILQCWSQQDCWLTLFPQLDVQVAWPAPVPAQAPQLSRSGLAIPL